LGFERSDRDRSNGLVAIGKKGTVVRVPHEKS
jgi:hypothetical protein